jgi:putative flippase GtrA
LQSLYQIKNNISHTIYAKFGKNNAVLISQFVKYIFAGGFAFIIDISILFLLTEYLNIHYLISGIFGFVAGLIVNYMLSIRWVFDTRNIDNQKIEFSIFTLIGIVGLALNELFLWVFTEYFLIHYLISKLMTVLLIFLWNFGMRKFLLFR